jgi:hypothetical protein
MNEGAGGPKGDELVWRCQEAGGRTCSVGALEAMYKQRARASHPAHTSASILLDVKHCNSRIPAVSCFLLSGLLALACRPGRD